MKEKEYVPSEKILDKYADLLINFALNDYKGIKKGDVVQLVVPEIAKPMLVSLKRAVLKAGGHPMIRFIPDDMGREFYELASDEQLKFYPKYASEGMIKEADHRCVIIAETNKHELKGISPRKMMMVGEAILPARKLLEEKENAGKYTWTLALYGTSAMAKEVGMTEKQYWNEIIKACYLDKKDPVKEWKKITSEIERLKKKLDSLGIERVHVESIDNNNVDLIVGLGDNRKWLGGSGRNIPSYEVFISPDCRITEGKIHFNKPLYRYGNLCEDITIWFKNGKVVKIKAKKGEKVIKEMVKVKGANMIGEFSLTDARTSRITKFMGETLFDENVGGKYGNMHVALGNAYKDSYTGNPSKVQKNKWKGMGYNESSVHTDIVNTENKKVTAFLRNGKKKVIYESGRFLV